MFVRDIIGEFELVEGHYFGHPLFPGGGGVRVDVHSLRHLRVRLPRHHPSGVVELVTTVVYSHDVH